MKVSFFAQSFPRWNPGLNSWWPHLPVPNSAKYMERGRTRIWFHAEFQVYPSWKSRRIDRHCFPRRETLPVTVSTSCSGRVTVHSPARSVRAGSTRADSADRRNRASIFWSGSQGWYLIYQYIGWKWSVFRFSKNHMKGSSVDTPRCCGRGREIWFSSAGVSTWNRRTQESSLLCVDVG